MLNLTMVDAYSLLIRHKCITPGQTADSLSHRASSVSECWLVGRAVTAGRDPSVASRGPQSPRRKVRFSAQADGLDLPDLTQTVWGHWRVLNGMVAPKL